MSARFGRNQKRKMQQQVLEAQARAQAAKDKADRAMREADSKLAQAMREHLAAGRIPLEVEHFIDHSERRIIMHAIFDEKRANLHYQHAVTPNELRIERDSQERERFGQYIGRAIADRLAEAYAGREKGNSRAAGKD